MFGIALTPYVVAIEEEKKDVTKHGCCFTSRYMKITFAMDEALTEVKVSQVVDFMAFDFRAQITAQTTTQPSTHLGPQFNFHLNSNFLILKVSRPSFF